MMYEVEVCTYFNTSTMYMLSINQRWSLLKKLSSKLSVIIFRSDISQMALSDLAKA